MPVQLCWKLAEGRALRARLCLASCRYHLQDYELALWDERSFDSQSHPLTVAAHRADRYALVSDYVGMAGVGPEWGLYMNVDVEVLARFDELLDSALLIGLEDRQRFATSIIGSEPEHCLPKSMLDYYPRTAFDPTRLSALVKVNEVSRLLLPHGFDGERVLPIGGFADARGQAKDVKGAARHLYAGTWRDERGKSRLNQLDRAFRRLPGQLGLVPACSATRWLSRLARMSFR